MGHSGTASEHATRVVRSRRWCVMQGCALVGGREEVELLPNGQTMAHRRQIIGGQR
jgi:hypothetical protein